MRQLRSNHRREERGNMRSLVSGIALGFATATALLGPSVASAQEPAAVPQSDDHKRMMAAAKVVQSARDTGLKGDFEGWLKHFTPDVVFIVNDTVVLGRAELRKVYTMFFSAARGAGLEMRAPEIIESGWTGDRIYVWQKEFLGEAEIVTYGEYEVAGDKISRVVASY
ncbi:nuclear transport factor 2 family protein [Erythrobacter sp. JK5]|uniref:nuclear transport factor 2 family protein n=1 Tax=Erythrobacter sp. JK5 TaxID=2829500 RepID=UPI001BA6EF93|nr:nuclear transport factor 2 family protein [Erythrobacter sp. JK5]QUL39182.1 nuclear transport factor 2 family protein [Erythrobacter sp. JK5]